MNKQKLKALREVLQRNLTGEVINATVCVILDAFLEEPEDKAKSE